MSCSCTSRSRVLVFCLTVACPGACQSLSQNTRWSPLCHHHRQRSRVCACVCTHVSVCVRERTLVGKIPRNKIGMCNFNFKGNGKLPLPSPGGTNLTSHPLTETAFMVTSPRGRKPLRGASACMSFIMSKRDVPHAFKDHCASFMNC